MLDFPGGSDSKASAYSTGNLGSFPGSGRSPGEGNGNPPQYSCLENPMDRGAWRATVHGVAKSRTQLSDFTFFLCPEIDHRGGMTSLNLRSRLGQRHEVTELRGRRRGAESLAEFSAQCCGEGSVSVLCWSRSGAGETVEKRGHFKALGRSSH